MQFYGYIIDCIFSLVSRPTKFDKVVSREICQITTRGTRMLNYQDEPMGPNNSFLLAICEKVRIFH